MRLLAPSGSLCGVLRGVETLVCALGHLRRASPREARTGRFSCVFGERCCAGFVAVILWCVAVDVNQSCFHAQLVKWGV